MTNAALCGVFVTENKKNRINGRVMQEMGCSHLAVQATAHSLYAPRRCSSGLKATNEGHCPVTEVSKMATLAIIATILVAALHVYFLVLEMFLWDSPTGRRVFGLTAEFSSASRVLAANQGLYNGFLAAGLLYGVWQGEAGFAFQVFFLVCVIIAGVFGAVTSSKKILYVQGVPGAIALALVIGAHGAW